MATKVDAAAAKQRQQKILLVVAGVILAGLVVFQGPKLSKQLKGSSKPTATPAVQTTPTSTTGTTTGNTATPAIVGRGGRGQAATVAGVILRPAVTPAAGTGQLWSLSRFKAKDPFVPQVKEDTSTSGGATTGTTTTTTPTKGGPSGALATPVISSPVALGYATLMVNGNPQQLQLKQLFPKGQPTFVLLAVDKKTIKIGVAGGKFTGGGAIMLDLGKPVTLMNTTTGQRFVIKLVFTGAQPEKIAGFKQPAAVPSSKTTSTKTATAATP